MMVFIYLTYHRDSSRLSALRMTTSLKLSLRGVRKGDEAIFLLRRLLRAYGARNDK
jgi:hypothetical protein